jgi:hypothetical protein
MMYVFLNKQCLMKEVDVKIVRMLRSQATFMNENCK